MNDFATVYNKLYIERQTKDPKTFIDLYEANQSSIENQNLTTSNPDFRDVMQIIADYGIALSYYGSTNKAIPYLDKAEKLFQEYAKFSNQDLAKIPMFETLIWQRGIDNYNLKNYNLAAKDFQYLVDNYPENDKYKNWLVGAKTIKSKKILNYIWMIAFVSYIWNIIATQHDDKNKDYFLFAGIAFTLIGFAMQFMNSLIKSSVLKKAN